MQGDALQVFDGIGNLLASLDRITFWTALKGFEREKKALALASRLEEAAFENCRRLDSKEKQDFDVIAVSLKKEFLGGAMDERLAVEEMRGRKWKQFEEPPAAFAHDIDRLVRLACPGFDSGSAITLAGDAFLDGLPRELQILLRRGKTTKTNGVKELAEEVNQLRLAGISSVRSAPANASPVNQSSLPASAVNQVCVCDMEIYNDMSSTRQTVNAFGSDSLDTQATVKSMRGRCRRWTPRRKYRQPRDPMLGKRCYICGDINHIRSIWPHFDDCHRCLRPGHVVRNCTAASSASKRRVQITNLVTALHGQ